MRPRRTDQDAEAFDAYYHSPDAAGALEFVNEYSGCAARPAPYNGFAELKLACSFL
jgi:hypothetical protein